MKKYILAIILAILMALTIGAVNASACVAPLTEADGNVMMYNEEDISLQNCYVEIRPAASYFAMTAEVSLKNNSEAKTVKLGLPVFFNGGFAQAQNVSVTYKGQTLKLKSRDASANPDIGTGNGNYSSFYTWDAEIGSNETATFLITLTVTTRMYKNDTQCIDLPLMLLNCWEGEGGMVNVLVDSAVMKVYSYERTPDYYPSSINEGGALEFSISKKDISSTGRELVINHNIDFEVLKKYYSNVYTSGDQKTVADLFKTRQYQSCIVKIDELGLTSNDFTFMKMVCYEKLSMTKEANEILASIYDKQVCFSSNNDYDIADYVSRRMLYDYYSLRKSEGANAATLNDILTKGTAKLTSKSKLFLDWTSAKQAELQKLIKASENEKEEEGKKDPDNNPSEKSEMSFKTWLKSISEPLVLTVGVVMIVVVVFCLMGILSGGKKKTKAKTHYIKR